MYKVELKIPNIRSSAHTIQLAVKDKNRRKFRSQKIITRFFLTNQTIRKICSCFTSFQRVPKVIKMS